jgi:hypothetical protein
MTQWSCTSNPSCLHDYKTGTSQYGEKATKIPAPGALRAVQACNGIVVSFTLLEYFKQSKEVNVTSHKTGQEMYTVRRWFIANYHPRCKCYLPYSGIVSWRKLIFTDVLGHPIDPIFKAEVVQQE